MFDIVNTANKMFDLNFVGVCSSVRHDLTSALRDATRMVISTPVHNVMAYVS